MTDPDEIEAVRKEYEALRAKLLLPEALARMAADGLNPDAEMQRLDALFQNAMTAVKASDEGDERMLQLLADKEDSLRALYQGVKAAIAELQAHDPLNPKLEEFQDLLEAWSERMPKEEL